MCQSFRLAYNSLIRPFLLPDRFDVGKGPVVGGSLDSHRGMPKSCTGRCIGAGAWATTLQHLGCNSDDDVDDDNDHDKRSR